ncbi:hypothetical protein ABZ883_40720 [Streptomyces sp. NPDC046977]|uniref:hypothetical protein n=1 Tax=Streptomyces sp. NPDC046977 TaxID=3154703 RepID=UPI0033C7A300
MRHARILEELGVRPPGTAPEPDAATRRGLGGLPTARPREHPRLDVTQLMPATPTAEIEPRPKAAAHHALSVHPFQDAARRLLALAHRRPGDPVATHQAQLRHARILEELGVRPPRTGAEPDAATRHGLAGIPAARPREHPRLDVTQLMPATPTAEIEPRPKAAAHHALSVAPFQDAARRAGRDTPGRIVTSTHPGKAPRGTVSAGHRPPGPPSTRGSTSAG